MSRTQFCVLLLATCAQFEATIAQHMRGGNEALKSRPLVYEPDWSLVDYRPEDVQELLKNTFEAVPKNEHGLLSHSAVRYMLNRYFVKKHGWNVLGLQTTAHMNISSPIELLHGYVLKRKMKQLEHQLKRDGFSFTQTIELAVLFETVIQNVMVHDLRMAYLLHDLPLEDAVSGSDIDAVLSTYMAAVIHNRNLSMMESQDVKWLKTEVSQYENWAHSETVLHRIRTRAELELDNKGKFTFSDTARLLPQIMEQFRTELTDTCQTLTEKLNLLEDRNRGCVRLDRLYEAFLKGERRFGESPAYLSRSGILDESDPMDTSVITRNYVALVGNCKRASPLHNICCQSRQCDDIFEEIEQRVGSPYASPDQILDIVAPFATVSDQLKARLFGLAQHERQVLLHGRLLAQWMHHVLPRECDYPVPASVPSIDWDVKYMFSSKDALAYLNNHQSNRSARRADEPEETCMAWGAEEELYVVPRDAHLSVIDSHLVDPLACLLLALITVTVFAAGRGFLFLRRLVRGRSKGSALADKVY